MRVVVAVFLAFVLTMVAAGGHAWAGGGGGCNGATPGVHRAGLVVTFGGEQATQTFCVEFTEESISGIELLERSGLSLVTQAEGGLGEGVCAINGLGSDDPMNCFKYSTTPPYRFWTYFRWMGTAWQFSNVGSSTRVIRDGDIDGWSWGNGAAMPPDGPGDVLAPPATATAEPTHTATPRPQATATVAGLSGETPSAVETRMPTVAGGPPTAVTAAASSTIAPTSAGAVAGSAATPPRETAAVVGTATPGLAVTAGHGASVTATATARSGVVVVDPTSASTNAATSRDVAGEGDGGGWVAIAGFAVVALALTAGGGFIAWRRRDRA